MYCNNCNSKIEVQEVYEEYDAGNDKWLFDKKTCQCEMDHKQKIKNLDKVISMIKKGELK